MTGSLFSLVWIMILLSWPEISSGEAMKPTRGQPSFETDFVFVQKKVYKNDVKNYHFSYNCR
jgi:hypothetical protein